MTKQFATAVALFLGAAAFAAAPRQMEYLDRGVVAMRGDDGVFVSWRLLATDPADIAFDIYRTGNGGEKKLNEHPITDVTSFTDTTAAAGASWTYEIRAAGENAKTEPASFTIAADSKPYLSVKLDLPENYKPNDASAADLDGDGQYDLVLKSEIGGKDNSQSGVTEPVLLDGLKLDGTRLWRINLGKNIRAGAHYTQFMVYDLDGDGYAEVACKTAPGTIDGLGKPVILGNDDPTAVYRNEAGFILNGPEYLTVFDGRTGAAKATVPYAPSRGITTNDPSSDDMRRIWGDGRGNRGDRFLAAVAYLDGERPSLVMCRGYYTRSFLAAWDYRDGKLTQRWLFDSDEQGKDYAGQGNHNISVADVDSDGRDEIIYGGMVVDDNGKGLYSTKLGHGDAMHVSDLVPSNPGLELVRIQERFDDAGLHMVDLKSGKVMWRIPSVKAATTGGDRGEGPGRGVSFDVDPRYPGSESWANGAGMTGMFDSSGNRIAPVTQGENVSISRPSCNFAIWWDGDELRELLDKTRIDKWDYEASRPKNIFDAKQFSCVSINGTKSNPSLSADLFGDWREELVLPTEDGKELRIFTTTIPTNRRLFTLMHDPVYRLGIAWQNTAYNQPPHTGFHLGHGMSQPPAANVKVVRAAK